MTEDRKTGIYIHFPFCVRKCNYCAFLSFSSDDALRRKYADALMREIEIAGSTCEKEISTVYLGGGTPSVMDVSLLSLIMDALRKNFKVLPQAEITIEANPGTLGTEDREVREKLSAYKYMGINRLSMGVQSMDDDRLALLGRIHSAEEVVRDYSIAREAGFDNINLDLIFSVPGETTEDALADAKKIVDLGPEHISCYSLQLEEGTPFYKMAERGKLTEVPDEEDRATYHKVCRYLREAGYEHYEISNFARIDRQGTAPGFGASGRELSGRYRSAHNSLYWNMSDYIGLGLGASGFADGIRYRGLTDINEYIKAASEGRRFASEEHRNTAFDNISEAVFTGLRRREGISYSEAKSAYLRAADDKEAARYADMAADKVFREIFAEARAESENYVKQGLMIMDDMGIRLTEEGIDISNGIMSLFV